MSYFPSQEFILFYSFKSLAADSNFDKMIKMLQATITKCEKYAKASDITFEAVKDTYTCDGIIGVNLHFKIHGDQDSILGKVASLFHFAELNKLGFCSQSLLTE